MKKVSIKVNQELNDSIQTIQVEMDGLKQLITYMVSTVEYVVPQERISALQDEFMKKNKVYNNLKSQVEALTPADFNKNRTSWNLNFATAEVEFVEE